VRHLKPKLFFKQDSERSLFRFEKFWKLRFEGNTARPFLICPARRNLPTKIELLTSIPLEVPFSPGSFYWSTPGRVYNFLVTDISGMFDQKECTAVFRRVSAVVPYASNVITVSGVHSRPSIFVATCRNEEKEASKGK